MYAATQWYLLSEPLCWPSVSKTRRTEITEYDHAASWDFLEWFCAVSIL